MNGALQEKEHLLLVKTPEISTQDDNTQDGEEAISKNTKAGSSVSKQKPIEAQKDLGSDKRPKADPCLKKILRAFRKEIKEEFVALYGKKYFHWIDKTSRMRDKEFFTSKARLVGLDGAIVNGYQFEEEFYDRNEAIFFSLIHNTKKDRVLKSIGIELMSFTNTM